MSRPLCSAAHTALLIDVDKGVRPCCAYEGKQLKHSLSIAKLGDQTLGQILSAPAWQTVRDQLGRREVPAGCVACIQREQLDGWSQRVLMERRRSPNWDRGITYLELSSSNLCNLQCRHCSSLFSSRWSAHEQRHGRVFAPVVQPDRELLLKSLRSVDLQHLEYVVVKGGEPMLNDDFAVLLEHLESIGVFANVTVDMVTNGTVIDARILAKLAAVRELRVCLSIDGVGDVQTYVRHGSSSIERIERAIATYAAMPNVTLTRNTSVMAYNVFQLDRVDAWWDGLAARFPGRYLRPAYTLFVLDPEALSVSCLQDHTRTALRERYTALDAKRYAPVIRMLEQPFAGVERHDAFVDWTLRTDAELGRDVLDAVPELAAEMRWLDEQSAAARAFRVRPRLAQERAQRERQLSEAAERQRVIEARRDAFHAAMQVGWQRLNDGDVDGAAHAIAATSAVDDLGMAALLHLQSGIAGSRGDLVGALSMIDRARSLAPQQPSLRLHRARVLEAMGRRAEALVDALAARGDADLRAAADELCARLAAALR